MLPQIHFLGKDISTYALCGIIGALIASIIFCRMIVKRDRNIDEGILLLVTSALGGVVGSHLLYGITHIHHWGMIFNAPTLHESFLLIGTLFGGSVFYGGLIGGLMAGYWYIRGRKLDRCDYADCAAICIPLFHSISRIGCFLSGCCYGIECEWGFASVANSFVPAVVGIKRFPTPLLESSLNLILFFILLALRNKQSLRGKFIHLYLIAYAVIRFHIEFLRGDAIRGIWFGVSTSQWISMGLFAFSVMMLVRQRIKRNTSNSCSATE